MSEQNNNQQNQGNQGGQRRQQSAQEPKVSDRPNLIVECAYQRNRTLSLNTLRMRLRGRFSVTSLIAESRRSVGERMQQMPDIPGMYLMIFGDARRVDIIDPLASDEKLRESVSIAMRNIKALTRTQEVSGVPPIKKMLDIHQYKTLMREISQKIKKKKMIVVSGAPMSDEDIAKLDGEFLYDPWSSNSAKPRFESQFEKWVENGFQYLNSVSR